MGLEFLKAFGTVKVSNIIQDATTQLASIDPKTASEAQMKILHDKQQEYAGKLVDAKNALKVEDDRIASLQASADRTKAALTALKARHDAATDETAKASIMTQASAVAGELKRLNDQIANEQVARGQAQEIVDSTKNLYDMMTAKLGQGQSKLESAQRRMELAKNTEAHAQMIAEMNGEAARWSGIDTAFDAFSAAAEKAEKHAEVLKMTSSKPGASTEAIIASALATATPKEDPFAALGN
jgi:SMC interacting uncharacterized protein involved in chromosome segregation